MMKTTAEKPTNKQLSEALDSASYTMDRAYLQFLRSNYKAEQMVNPQRTVKENIRIIEVCRWVKNSKESIIDCFRNVLGIFSSDKQNNIALIINRTAEMVRMYFAISNAGPEKFGISNEYCNLLVSALHGNFTGSEFKKYNGTDGTIDTEKTIKELFGYNEAEKDKGILAASIITGIPSEKSPEYMSQGIEKILEGIVPGSTTAENKSSYSIVILAEPLSFDMIHSVLNGYEELASSLSPFSSLQLNFSENQSESNGENSSFSVTNLIGEAITKTHSVNVSAGVSFGNGSVGGNASAGYSYSQGKTISTGKSDSETTGTNYMVTEGTGVADTYTLKSYPVSGIIEKAEKNIRRIQNANADGLWEYATYVLSNDKVMCKNVAGSVAALVKGDESYIESPSITHWSFYEEDEEKDFKMIVNSIMQFTHPYFKNKNDNTLVSATSYITTAELAALFAFPRKSLPGIPIIECAKFGRNVVTYDDMASDSEKIELGSIFHMHHKENNDVYLEKNSLASHTFITGSTGSGKSNTVYRILNEAIKAKTKFLVIEPAKGEYKHVFGNRNGVSVYGTNLNISPLLRLNPFSFPKGIHILEHLDRLVEIFNVCWPMYAAMPAVLKNAIEKSYEDCGWNLTESENSYGDNLYPQFSDVARNIKAIIDSSEYDTDNKGAYKGSLLTRLNSLTNGINGIIFTPDEIENQELFDGNVIVDLSRVGSSETKSLIMGTIVLKLQEYRMTQGKMNAPLRHITVLEEAHNLLKRTSTEQVSESANLLGKSVEMISNSIAEMRTYGEGFIIADQSPGLLDMAAIRNTNTKIIMRLPDITDRELVGKAANLDENQIAELAKLPCGVAAVYQSEWIQPVLCKIARFDIPDTLYEYQREKNSKSYTNSDDMVKIAELLSNGTNLNREKIFTDVLPKLKENSIRASVQIAVAKQLENPPKEPRMTRLAPIMSALFPKVKNAVISAYNDNPDASEWTRCAEEALLNDLNITINDITRRDIIQANIIQYVYLERGSKADVDKWKAEGGLQ